MKRILWALLCLAAVSAHADVAVNAGGESTGIFVSDRYFSGGSAWRYSTYTGVYDTERYSVGGSFSYAIPVTPGTVEVTLLLRESCIPCSYTRTFNVDAEGTRVLSNVTVPTNTMTSKVFRIATDATLNLKFTTVTGEAYVNAIQVKQVADGAPPPPPPTPTVNLSANPSSISDGSSSTLTWTSSDADSCTASGAWSGSRAVSGSQSTGALSATSAYTLTCSNSSGSTSSSTTVTVSAPTTPAPTVSISANPTTISSGGSSTITWTTSNATSCTASNAWTGSQPTSGSTSTGALSSNATYTLTCTGAGGSTTRSATVTVSQTAFRRPSVTISASPSSINSGDSSTLTWSATGTASCTASGAWSGSKPTSGSVSTGALSSTSTYTLACSNSLGTTTRSATVTVNAIAAPSVGISASPSSINTGGSSTLTWSSTNATSCTASGAWSGSKATSGTASTGALSATSTYTLACSNTGGTTTRSATVTVTQVAAPSVSISASPSSINSGGSSTLTWSSTNATSCTASGAWSGSKTTSGTASTGALSTTSTYTLACSNTGGTTTRSATVTVSQPAPTVTLTANPSTVDVGESSTLTWTSANATSCTASGAWSGGQNTSGSTSTGNLSSSATYTLTCSNSASSASSTQTVTVRQAGAAAFPLAVSPNKRYLVDARGAPFLIQGDTGWSLIADLSREDADRYLTDRAARGFNTILVNLIEHQFARNAPRNFYGAAPFTKSGDFSTPNEAYFAHADYVIQRAHDLGLAVLLAPAYLGYGGGSQGWYSELSSNTSAQRLAYGRFLGQRYRSFDNIIWTPGGDYNPPSKSVVRDVMQGIRESDADAVTTAHTAPETSAADYWGTESWLTLNTVYTYNAVYTSALSQYQRSGPMPFFLIESAYENEQGADTIRIRTQAYHAVLSGAAGQMFGNNPIWHFSAAGLFSAPYNWQQAMSGSGSTSMTQLKKLFDTLDWWTLVPDTTARLITSGASSGQSRAVGSIASDGSFAVAYVPTRRAVTYNLNSLAGPRVSATWYDPANGTSSAASGSPFAKASSQSLTAPSNNSGGGGDWVLVLKSVP